MKNEEQKGEIKIMGYHSGLNGEYSIPVEVNSKYIKHFRRCCKEEVPEKAIKVETYLKDDTIYFVLPSNYRPVKICFDNAEELRPSAPPEGVIYGGKGNQKLNVDFSSTGHYQNNDYVNISDSIDYININDSTNYAQPNNTYVSIFDSLLDLSKQVNAMGYKAEDASDVLNNIFDKLYNK